MAYTRLKSVLRGLGPAYSHLPLLIAAYLLGGSWRWLLFLGVFPWIGMAYPFLLLVSAASLALLPGVFEGHPAAWLAPPVPAIILFGGTLGLFLPFYWLNLDRVVDHAGGPRRRWLALMVLWTLSGNAIAVLLEPRGFR